MRKILELLIILLIVPASVLIAQDQPLQTKKKSTRFQSYNAVILLAGSQTVSGGIQSVNGFQWNTFFAGVGLGLDYYRFGTMPLFMDLRKTFGKGRNKGFVYGDIGYNFSWPANSHQNEDFVGEDGIKGGLYNDIGIGWLREFGKKSALVLSMGYSFKSMGEQVIAYPLCIPGYPCEPTVGSYEYRFNRLSFKAGWRF